jgi:hypothetical protein
MSSNKIVRASYTTEDVFCIPKNINLEDKTQVKSWNVKYNTLYIYLTNGKELEISNRGWIDSCDYKYPRKTEILDAEEVGIDDDDDEDFEEVDLEEEEEEVRCPHCDRNEEKCEEEAENEKNPITEWCGWGLSCDDCYYKNHPESDDDNDN